MAQKNFTYTPFSAIEPRRADAQAAYRQQRNAYAARQGAVRSRAGSMLVKIGVCAGILALAFALEVWILDPPGGERSAAIETDAAANGSDEGDGEALGRLKFVSTGGGVRSVFRVSQRWELPVRRTGDAVLDEQKRLLSVPTDAGSTVTCPAEGRVSAIGTDAVNGTYVRIDHGSDLESVYYHLGSVSVEEGQSLSWLDTLGTADETGVVRIEILRNGISIDPTAYLDTDA